MGVAVWGVNGISPHLSKTLTLTYLNLAALGGLEPLYVGGSDITTLEKYWTSPADPISS